MKLYQVYSKKLMISFDSMVHYSLLKRRNGAGISFLQFLLEQFFFCSAFGSL